MTSLCNKRERRYMNPQVISEFLRHFANLGSKSHFLRLLGPVLLPMQSFNGFGRHHWMEWLGATIEFMSFSNGFGVRQPLVSMDFDGYSPLVRRYNGYTFTNTVLVNMFNNMQYQTTFQNEKCQSSVNKHFRKLCAPLIFSLARLSPEVSRGFHKSINQF